MARTLPLDSSGIVMWNIAAKKHVAGDPMAEASVLAAPGAHLADNSRKALWAAGIGNVLEWYDFARLCLCRRDHRHRSSFRTGRSTASLLASFAAFGVGFVARPLGGIMIGRLGDTKGRKTALLLTIFLMAFGTVAIGLLPSYEAIGVWAPSCWSHARLMQGFAAGGEWGASTAFIVEWAPQDRRGLFGSFQQSSSPAACCSARRSPPSCTSIAQPATMDDWGWRVPFLLGVLLLSVGAYHAPE